MSGPAGPRASAGRIAALEGLRGIAATIVVLRHTTNAMALPEPARRGLLESPLAPLFDAQAAVALFFVLSGFVLTGSLERGSRGLAAAQFWVKRLFRIHPPYVAALLVTWLASFIYLVPDAAAPFTNWLRSLASVHLAPSELAAALLYPGPAGHQLDVGWTLAIEMTWSLLLPLLFWLARATHWSVAVALAAAPLGFSNAPLFALYGLHFALGMALALERRRVEAGFARIPKALASVLWIVALVFSSAPLLLGWHTQAAGILMPDISDPAAIAIRLPGSLLLIALAFSLPWWRALLEHPVSLFLGRISYSLYLLHMGVLVLATRILSPQSFGSQALLIATVLAVSTALAWLFHRVVERPAVLLGNRVCAAIAGRAGTQALRSRD